MFSVVSDAFRGKGDISQILLTPEHPARVSLSKATVE